MPKKHQIPASKKQRKPGVTGLSWLWVILGIVVIAVAAFFLFRPVDSSPTEISVAQAYQKLQQGALFLDVRTQAEFDQGHISGGKLIPLDQLPGRLAEVPVDRDIVVICRSGVRSKEGMTILRNGGYSRAVCMTGGLIAWKAAGYSLEGSNP